MSWQYVELLYSTQHWWYLRWRHVVTVCRIIIQCIIHRIIIQYNTLYNIKQTTGFLGALSTLRGMCFLSSAHKSTNDSKTHYIIIGFNKKNIYNFFWVFPPHKSAQCFPQCCPVGMQCNQLDPLYMEFANTIDLPYSRTITKSQQM